MAAIAWGWLLLLGGMVGAGLGGLLVWLLAARRHTQTAAALQAQLHHAEVASAVLQTRLDAEQQNAAEKLAVLTEARGELTAQFQQLASDILEDKSRRFSAFALSVMSSIDMPPALAAQINAPMLVPARSAGWIPFSSRAARTPIWANPLSPPPPRTRAIFRGAGTWVLGLGELNRIFGTP